MDGFATGVVLPQYAGGIGADGVREIDSFVRGGGTLVFKGDVLARYQTAGSPLLSGHLTGEKFLHGKAAALQVQHEAGRVVLLGFRLQWRGQPFGSFRAIFNAALNVPAK